MTEILIGTILVAFGLLALAAIWHAERHSRSEVDERAADYQIVRLPGETTPELEERIRREIALRDITPNGRRRP